MSKAAVERRRIGSPVFETLDWHPPLSLLVATVSMESADLLLTLATGAEALRQSWSRPAADEHDSVSDPEKIRSSLPRL